jgi:superfamily II DNA or RNA helicase
MNDSSVQPYPAGSKNLRVLDSAKLKWRLPQDDVGAEVVIPALREADRFDCMVGFFGGQALRQLAPGLAAFICDGDHVMRLLVSPLLSDEDLAGIRLGLSSTEEVLSDAIGATLADAEALEDALVNHTLHCLAYLLAAERLDMKVVLVEHGIFHVKEWIFGCGEDIAVLAGSANFTGRAMTQNIESLYLHRSWRDLDNLNTCTESLAEFEILWNGNKQNTRTVDLPTAVRDDLIRTYGDGLMPTEADFELAFTKHSEEMERPDSDVIFAIPSMLEIWTGAYSHQGEAIDAWEAAQRRGILAMATGSGKTISALSAAQRLYSDQGKLMLVIAVPTKPLVNQWAAECADFGLRPIVAPSLQRTKRLRVIQQAVDNLTFGVSEVESIIVTNDGLVDPELEKVFASFDGPSLLVADEVHNLGGVKSFLQSPPKWPKARLGLSATPDRQYDADGSESLIDYFGETVFEFSLEQAIGVCLVPYDYFLHKVDLTAAEFERYAELSERIRKRIAIAGGGFGGDDLQLTILLNQRRLVLETASGKLRTLERILDQLPLGSVKRSLFYATDKDPAQLKQINEMLRARRIRAHQITEAETSSGRLLSATLAAFSEGKLHALTAKRVLDEGLNVPQIDTAYILASTTVKKQWTQRRGRVLRPSPETGKTHAVIHDFVVLPPISEHSDEDERKLVKSELVRCDEFARLARNRASKDGPFGLISEIRNDYIV